VRVAQRAVLLALSLAWAGAFAADAESVIRLVDQVELPHIREKFNPLLVRSRARLLLRHIGKERGFSKGWNIDTPEWRRAEEFLVSSTLGPAGRRLPDPASLPGCLEKLEPTDLAALSDLFRSAEWHAKWQHFDARGWALPWPFGMHGEVDPSVRKEYEELSRLLQSRVTEVEPPGGFQPLISKVSAAAQPCVVAALERIAWRHVPPNLTMTKEMHQGIAPFIDSFEKESGAKR
jgi:hypothetical protein